MSVSSLFAKYSAASGVLEKRDLDVVHRLAALAVAFLRERVVHFMRSRSQEPLQWQCSSDVTPVTTCERFRYRCDEAGSTVARCGRSSGEFLVQRCWVADSTGDSVVCMERPLLMADKTAITHWKASRSLMKMPQEYSHDCIAVVHHVYDRALMRPMSRLHLQCARVVYEDQAESANHLEGDAHRRWLLTWVSTVGCFAHDIHGGLKWSLLTYTSDKDCMRSMFICIESLRNSFNLLVAHVGGWRESKPAGCSSKRSDL